MKEPPHPDTPTMELLDAALTARTDFDLFLFAGAVVGRIYSYARPAALKIYETAHRWDAEGTRELLRELKDTYGELITMKSCCIESLVFTGIATSFALTPEGGEHRCQICGTVQVMINGKWKQKEEEEQQQEQNDDLN